MINREKFVVDNKNNQSMSNLTNNSNTFSADSEVKGSKLDKMKYLLDKIEKCEEGSFSGSQDSSDSGFDSSFSPSSALSSSQIFKDNIVPFIPASDEEDYKELLQQQPPKRKVGRPPKNSHLPTSFYEKFIEYIEAGDAANVQSYLRKVISVEQLTKITDVEPLEHAIKYGQLEIFKLLFHIYNAYEDALRGVLKHLSFNINSFPPEFQLVIKNAVSIVSESDNSSRDLFRNAFQRCCMFNNRERLFRHLRKNPSLTKKQLEQLIDTCCIFSSQDCLKLLLNHSETLSEPANESISEEDSNEDSNSNELVPKRKRGRPPKNKMVTNITQLVAGLDDKNETYNIKTLKSFFNACSNQDLNEIRRLFPKVNINSLNPFGNTALFESCKNNVISVAALLLANGADPNIRCGKELNSPLHIVAVNGNYDLVSLLMAFNANTSCTNSQGLIPEELTSNKKIIEILKSTHSISRQYSNDNEKIPLQKSLLQIEEKILILSFPDTALTYCLQRQTNRIVKRLGGLRKTTYRNLLSRHCTDEEVELLLNQSDTMQIVMNLDRHAVNVIESGEFLDFFRREYSNKVDLSSLKIEKIPLLFKAHAMPPKMAHKFK